MHHLHSSHTASRATERRHCTVQCLRMLLELTAVDNSYRSAEDGQNQFTLSLRGAAPAMALYTCVRKVSRSCCVAASISCKPCSTQMRIECLTSNRQSPSIVHSIQKHVCYQELCGHPEDTRYCKHSCDMAACCTLPKVVNDSHEVSSAEFQIADVPCCPHSAVGFSASKVGCLIETNTQPLHCSRQATKQTACSHNTAMNNVASHTELLELRKGSVSQLHGTQVASS